MATIDFSPLYRNSVGFDRIASLLDSSLRGEQKAQGYPPYNIEVLDDNRYEIAIAVAGYERNELEIQVENGVLTIRGKKAEQDDKERQYLYRGIANRGFERHFDLADHVEVTDAKLNNGLLTIDLVKEIPEAMKPKKIAISGGDKVIEHQSNDSAAA